MSADKTVADHGSAWVLAGRGDWHCLECGSIWIKELHRGLVHYGPRINGDCSGRMRKGPLPSDNSEQDQPRARKGSPMTDDEFGCLQAERERFEAWISKRETPFTDWELWQAALESAPQAEPRREPKGRTEGLDVYYKGSEVYSASGPNIWGRLAEFALRQAGPLAAARKAKP